MSPDPTGSALRVRLARIPSGARLSAHGLEELEAHRRATELQTARDEGRAQAAREAAGALCAAAERLEAAREQAEHELAGASAQLAVEIVRALLHHELDAERYDIERIVRESLAASGVRRGEAVVVHLNPSDVEQLGDVPFRADTSLVPDAGLARAEVQISTPHGVLVRDLELTLDAIANRLREELA